MAAAAGLETTTGREGGGAPPPGPVILNPRDFLDTFPSPTLDHHNPFHGSEAYQTQIAEFSAPTAAPARNCEALYRCVKACGCGARVVRDHCDNLDCSHPYCEDVNRGRRARDIYQRLEQARNGRPVIYTVLTVPPSRRQDAAVDKTWRRWIRQLVSYMKKHLQLQYAVERSDPAGEDGETWHPHVNLLWIRLDGKGFLDPDVLDALKARWKKILKMRADDVSNVYTQFSSHDAKLRHWASYLGRCWPRWVEGHKYLLRVKWFGRPPKVEDAGGEHLCKLCGEEVVVLRFGSLEAAEEMAARGVDVVRAEYQAGLDELRKLAERRSRPKTGFFVDGDTFEYRR